MIRPFDETGITRGADQILRYDKRPNSLTEMLRATVDRMCRDLLANQVIENYSFELNH